MLRNTIAILALSAVLAGCSAFKNPFSNGVDNTVLPGERVDVLDTNQQVSNNKATLKSTTRAPGVLGTGDPSCEPSNPDYPECLTPPDPAAPDAGAASEDATAIDEESTVAQ